MLQHFEINFDGKINAKKRCLAILRFPLVAMVTENVVAKAIVQSTFVPSLISIEAVFIVLEQFELVTGDFSVKTAIFNTRAISNHMCRLMMANFMLGQSL
jgi:hypothetical protein